MKQHCDALVELINSVVNDLDDCTEVKAMMQEIGEKHGHLSVSHTHTHTQHVTGALQD
jgi:hypothetical protein